MAGTDVITTVQAAALADAGTSGFLGLSMEFLLATGIGWVTACGIWLLLRGRSFPVVLGLSLLGYAVNVFIFAMGRLWRNAPPVLGQDGAIADPLPQALVLTAIVIGFATTGFVIELALRARDATGTDHVDGQAPPPNEVPPTDPLPPPGATTEIGTGPAGGER
jgi:multicomponent K+:H+ antiporter subunit C